MVEVKCHRVHKLAATELLKVDMEVRQAMVRDRLKVSNTLRNNKVAIHRSNSTVGISRHPIHLSKVVDTSKEDIRPRQGLRDIRCSF